MRIFRRKRMKQKREESNKGFTFIELLVAISILSTCIVPLVGVFVGATKANSKAKRQLQAQITANSILESVQAYTIYTVDDQCRNAGSAANFKLIANINSSDFQSGTLTVSGNKVSTIGVPASFQKDQEYYAYYIEGLRQTEASYDALIVYKKHNYTDMYLTDGTVNAVVGEGASSGSGATAIDISGASQDLYNRQFDVTVWIYKHGEQPWEDQDITQKGDAIVMETGTKLDSTQKVGTE